MTPSKPTDAHLPADAARYLQGAPEQSHQFDFLIGQWDVSATRYGADGSVQWVYPASWCAQHVNDGRMVMDEFRAQLPDGREIACYVTLRTYCDTLQRWELTGLASLQPAAQAQWHGQHVDGDMLLEAAAKDAQGQSILSKIRFFDIQPDAFQWENRVSHDEGKSWLLSASLVARRSAATAPSRREARP